jgi:hypothetical protein
MLQNIYEKYTCSEFINRHSKRKNNKNRFYVIWKNLRQRCINENNPSHKWYGGRRIGFLITIEEIIKLWYRDKAWLLNQPSIDRKDNNGHYTVDNCQFIELIKNVKKSHRERKFNKLLVDNKLR